MITAVSPVLRCAARALFRFRKSAAAAWRWLGANAKVLAPFSPTRLRSHFKARRRPIRTYDGTRMPAWQRERTNWCHGLPAESGHGRLSASITQGAEDGRRWPNHRFFRWWPPFTLLDGPGETLNGSVRPRRASLRPDGVRTVPTAPGRDPRCRKGVKVRRSGSLDHPEPLRQRAATPGRGKLDDREPLRRATKV